MPDTPLNRLVNVYIDAVVEAGGRADQSETAWARNKIVVLLHDDVPEEVIAEAIRKMVARGRLGGYTLGTFVNEVLMEHKAGPDRQLLDEFLDAHDGRWPTGVRFVRGSHSGTYVADPLGYDRADYGQWRYPNRQEVLDALRARKG